ncbi:hypothetical protein DFH28DRAFT_1135703 [Melampsora americana]|nr:hypothetical protein DFH28DRAFT_1135703 [Melampsora americana]
MFPLFNPLNPLCPLPAPTRNTKRSGLTCSSVNCAKANRPAHSTIYYRPQKYPKLIAITCPHDSKYHRRLFIAQHKENIRQHNLALALAMIVDPQLTSDTSTPSSAPSTIRSSGSARSLQQCEGVHGQFAPSHSKRKNNNCIVNACRDPHDSMARRIKNLIKTSNIITSDAEPINSSAPAPSTQSGRTYSRLLLTSELDKFKSISIERQVNERTRRDFEAIANKQITLVVWTGSEVHRGGYWGGVVYAPQWPLLMLNQSEDLMKLAYKHLGEGWNGSLQVWHEHNRLWLNTAIGLPQRYSTESRKLLILFPDVDPTECEQLNNQLETVSSNKRNPMLISKYLTPSPRKNAIDIDAVSDNNSSQSPLIGMNHFFPGPPAQSTSQESLTNTAEASSLRYSSDEQGPKADRWPGSCNMSQLRDFLMEMSKDKTVLKDAWHRVFTGRRYRYKKSTVSRYYRWLKKIDIKRLDPYLAQYGSPSVTRAIKYFHNEWVATADTRTRAQPSQSPSKVVRLD